MRSRDIRIELFPRFVLPDGDYIPAHATSLKLDMWSGTSSIVAD